MRLPGLALLSGLLLVGAAVSAEGAEPSAEPVITAEVRNPDSGEKGSGFLVRSGDRCLLVTAAHVVRDGTEIEVAAVDQPLLRSTDKIFAGAGLDIALVPVTRPLASCPTPPSETAIRRSVQEGQGVLLVGLGGGQQLTLPVTIAKVSDDKVDIKPVSNLVPIQAGMSGAVLVVGGTPIAILSNKETRDDGFASAIRLDYAARILGPRLISLTVVVVQQGDEVARASTLLDQAIRNRPGSDMGQVGAVQTLAAAGKGIGSLDLQGVFLARLQIDKLQAADVNLSLADLSGAALTDANLAKADLTFAILRQADLAGSNLTGALAPFAQGLKANFANATLTRSSWIAADLSGSAFRGAALDAASFAFADLRNADFRGARFKHVVFAGSDLRGALFDQDAAGIESIDVTAALFSDNTFPPALHSKLCASLLMSNLTLNIIERRKSDEFDDGFRYTDLAKWQPPLPSSRAMHRYFPECPLRVDVFPDSAMIWSTSETRSAFAADRIKDGKPAQAPGLSGSIRARLSSEVLDQGGRRSRVEQAGANFVKAYTDRYAALPSSNRFYTDRVTRLANAINARVAAMAAPTTIRFTEDVRSLIANRFSKGPEAVKFAAAARLAQEQELRRAGLRTSDFDSWPSVFPEDVVSEDLTGAVLVAVSRWNDARFAGLRGLLTIPRQDYPDAYGRVRLRPISIDEVMARYDPAPPEEVARKRLERGQICQQAIWLRNMKNDPAKYQALAAQLSYFGGDIDECKDIEVRSSQRKVPNPPWYTAATRILKFSHPSGNANFLIVYQGTVPDEVLKDQYHTGALTLNGKIESIIQLSPDSGEAQTDGQIVIRLSGVTFSAE